MKTRLRLSLLIFLLVVISTSSADGWPDENAMAGSPPTLAGGEYSDTVTNASIEGWPFVLRLAATASDHSKNLSGVTFLLLTDENARWLKIFVTSVSGNGNLSSWPDANGSTGLAAADAICQSCATAAGLPGTFKAWLSDENDDAYCRVRNLAGKKSEHCGQVHLPYAGPWVRTDGFPFSGTIDELLEGEIYTPVRYDEFGNLVASTFYFTNTFEDGTVDSSNSSCANWTSNGSSSILGAVTDFTTHMWTDSLVVPCSQTGRLLCMQTGPAPWPPLPNFASTGKKAFVTSVSGSAELGIWPDGVSLTGLAAGDSICRIRAQAAGLPNALNFKAWLSTSTIDAKDHLTSNGPWVRLDGVKIADNKADLMDGSLFTSINLTEDFAYIRNVGVWTGTESSGMKSAATCMDWTSSYAADYGTMGTAANAGGGWTATTTRSCATEFHLYCFED